MSKHKKKNSSKNITRANNLQVTSTRDYQSLPADQFQYQRGRLKSKHLDLTSIEDRRNYVHRTSEVHKFKTIDGSFAPTVRHLQQNDKVQGLRKSLHSYFSQPGKTLECIRRRRRRRFLFSMRRGRGASIKFARWTEKSLIRC